MKVIREIDVDEEIKIGFSSIICRADKNLEKERIEINTKLKRYCEGKGFIFVENNNINESGLNNSKRGQWFFYKTLEGHCIISEFLFINKRMLTSLATFSGMTRI